MKMGNGCLTIEFAMGNGSLTIVFEFAMVFKFHHYTLFVDAGPIPVLPWVFLTPPWTVNDDDVPFSIRIFDVM
jgi:hypothetical protein